MQSINLELFRMLDAGVDPNPVLLQIARLVSVLASWVIVAVLAVIALRNRRSRTDVLVAFVCAGLISMLSHFLTAWFDTPRPFMMGLSPDYAQHSSRGGFPSTHASVMFAVAIFMAWRPRLRAAAVWVALLALATGLARIYLGVHFPFDVLGGLAVGVVGGTTFAALGWLIERLLQLSRRSAPA